MSLHNQEPVTRYSYAEKIDQGLREYMLKVFNYMALGLALTGGVAFFASTSMPLMQLIHGTPLKFLIMLAPLAFCLMFSFKISSMKVSTAQSLFWAFATIMGLSLSYIFLAYTGTSVARVFFITSSMFGAMSLYGYTTQKDLTGMGSFLMMGVIGLVVASLVNLFLQSSALSFAISCIGVIAFTGLTAYDVQNIKNMYFEDDHGEVVQKKAILGALTLYLDFINLFISLLRLFGERRD